MKKSILLKAFIILAFIGFLVGLYFCTYFFNEVPNFKLIKIGYILLSICSLILFVFLVSRVDDLKKIITQKNKTIKFTKSEKSIQLVNIKNNIGPLEKSNTIGYKKLPMNTPIGDQEVQKKLKIVMDMET